jgi:hypothetical protein
MRVSLKSGYPTPRPPQDFSNQILSGVFLRLTSLIQEENMERKRVVAIVLAVGLAFWFTSGASAQDKGGGGPYGLPTLADVKDKVKPSDEESTKVEEIYTQAAKNEQETKARAKENGTDGKTLAGYISLGRVETINKVKEALDKEKAKAFDQLCLAQQPAKKKK